MTGHACLNKIFRLVWSPAHAAWVAVPETGRSGGRQAARLAAALGLVAATPFALAAPAGGQVTNGQASIVQSGTTTTVTQASQNASLSWQSFNTTAQETVNFVQPSASAIAVNRIADTNGTQFLGHLNANGQVWLLNPNGVLFGSGAQVNVGGLVASTLDVADAGLGGAARRFTGGGTGSVVNEGTITTAQGGYAALVGHQAINHGTITAPGGTVALAAGNDVTLTFAQDSLVSIQVQRSALDDLAANGGLIRADGGTVLLSAGAHDAVLASAVNNTGVIQARSAHAVEGAIVLDGGGQGTVANDGTLDASGRAPGATGGTVKMLGRTVSLGATGAIDVSGDAGGGTAIVGGNFHGEGPEQNAQGTALAAGSSIAADALTNGRGGNVAVWSDGTTHADGRISARGGAVGGDGGQVETSGATLKVAATASVDTQAPHGTSGDWLLDPNDITIGAIAFWGPSYGIDVDTAVVTNALNNGNVTIKTTGTTAACTGISCGSGTSGNGDIRILDAIGYTPASYDANHNETDVYWQVNNYTLTLSAYRNINFVHTFNYYSAAAGYTTDMAGGIELGINGDGGNVVLRADNAGRGTGTVTFDQGYIDFGAPNSTVKIYYTPTSYASPTDYSQYVLWSWGGNQLSSYMAVNVTSTIASKTYDRTTTGTVSTVGTRATLPSGVTLDTSAKAATFSDKNVGTGKTVTLSGISFTGGGQTMSSGGNNYYLNGLDSQTGTITQKSLAVTGVTAAGKTYNGTTGATLAGTAAVSAIAGDVVSLGGTAVGTFADRNAGTNKNVTVTGYTLSGTDSGNYALAQPTGLTATIAQANLAVSGISASGKTYNGTTAAALTGSASVSAIGSDVVSVSGTGIGTFADKNAGTNKGVTVTGYTLSGADSGNYAVVQPTGLTATIAKANLSVSGVSASGKTYDGTTADALTGTASVSAIGGDVVSVSGTGVGTFADKNAGTNKGVAVTGYTLTGIDAGNYAVVQPTGLTATIAKANLSVSGVSASGKTYDGTTADALTGTASVSAIGGDVVSVSGTGVGTFADKNAGTNKGVAVTGYTLTGADSGNYTVVQPTGLTATVSKANLAVTGLSASGKTYDATTSDTLSGTASVSAIGSDVVSVTGTGVGTFSDKNAGTNKGVTVTGFTLTGTDAGNYTVVQPTGLTATITKANLAVTGLSAAGKTYDATTADTLSGTASVSAIGSDVVSVTGTGVGTFTDKNAGVNKSVSVTGYSLTGTDASNYAVVQPTGLTATISRANLAVTGVSASGKTYDATTSDTLSGTASVSAIGSDVVSVSGTGIGTFFDKNAGLNKSVSVSGYSLTGTDAGNYTVVQPTGLTATISQANLAVTGLSAAGKTYDATTSDTLSGAASVSAIGSDVVSVTGTGIGTFSDKNAGTNKGVTVTGFTLTGTDAVNYTVVQPTGLTATIAKANLAVSGVSAAGKTYDGTTTATLQGTASVSALGSDVVAVAGSGVGAFADKNAGTNKSVAVTGYSITGTDAGNYTLVQPGGVTATIFQANLAVSGLSASGKTYDGTTAAALTGSATVSAIGSDLVSLGGTGVGTFVDKNAGAGKSVSVSGYTLSGIDAGNYTLAQPTGLAATITRASLAVSGVSAAGSTYDGTTAATLSGIASVSAIGGDLVSVTGTGVGEFADKNAGTNKNVAVAGYALAGADAGNYALVQPTGITATIARADLAVAGVSASGKTYDGTTSATLSGIASVSAIGGDLVSVTGTGVGVFSDKNAGSNKGVSVSGYTLTGTDAANYAVVQPAGLTASIGKASLTVSGVLGVGQDL